MMKEEKQYREAHQEHVTDEQGFTEGEDYPNCEGEPCANVAEEEAAGAASTAKMADDAAQWKDSYVRLQAEFDNYRKRTLKEKMELVSSASEGVVKSLLPILDDLDRALEAMETAEDVKSVREGVVLISNKLRDTLRGKGVTEIDALGKVLDTDFHEAVAKVPGQKSAKGKIIDVVQKGYKLNDKVIRHSKVVVGE